MAPRPASATAARDARSTASPGWLKTELHSHCNADPHDSNLCPYSAEELIDAAAAHGYGALAITCHDLDVWSEHLDERARRRGIVLIPGMEVSLETGEHVLVHGFRAEASELDTLEKIRARKREDTLVVAPHAFYPGRSCLGRRLERNLDLFDAIETCGYFATGLDFNRRALRLAREHGKPIVGNGDVHYLWQLGKTFSWVEAEPTAEAVMRAIRRGAVRAERRPLSHWSLLRWWIAAIASRLRERAASSAAPQENG
jgi:predicted metal-dependent phosphoesterase TrpH